MLSTFQRVAIKSEVNFRYYYIDLTSPKSFFGALNELAVALDGSTRRYRKGIPLEHMQAKVVEAIGSYDGFLCLMLDEVDNLRPDADGFLTFLGKTLPRKVSCRLVLILLTNRLDWEKTLDARLLSFLKKTDILFEPYDAVDLLEILKLRVEKALDPKKVDLAALKKVAAFASRETGDARKAVELFAKAVTVAEETSGRLTEREVDLAEQRLEVDKTMALVKALATQQRLALEGCYSVLSKGEKRVFTGQAYDSYRRICEEEQVRPLTQRRFSDIIGFLDLYGLINARVISKGRYGNTREISSSLTNEIVLKVPKPSHYHYLKILTQSKKFQEGGQSSSKTLSRSESGETITRPAQDRCLSFQPSDLFPDALQNYPFLKDQFLIGRWVSFQFL